MHWLRAFHDRPAIIATLLHTIDHLPELPADVADPQVTGLAIEAHPPGVTKAVSIHLGPGSGRFDERIVGRNGVRFAVGLVIHVDTQDRGEKIADVLTGVEDIRWIWVGGIAGGDVKVAVGPKVQIA